MTAVAKLRQALDQLQQASAVAAGGQFDQDAIFTAADALDAAQAGELLRLGGAPTQALSRCAHERGAAGVTITILLDAMPIYRHCIRTRQLGCCMLPLLPCPPHPPLHRSQFGRSLAAALAPLASLEQPLQAALRAPLPDRGMYIRLQAAACAVSGGAQLAACCLDPLPAEVAAALAAGASLLVAAGTPLLANLANPAGRQALRRLFPNNRSARVDRTVKMLADGVANVGNAVLRPAPVLVQQLLGQAPLATGRRPLLKGALAPRRLLPFLSATAAAVLAAADDPAGGEEP